MSFFQSLAAAFKGGADAVRFATIDTLQGVIDHTDFLIV